MKRIKNYLAKMNVKHEISTHNNLLTVIGYFHDLTQIKRELFKNEDECRIERLNNGMFKLNALVK